MLWATFLSFLCYPLTQFLTSQLAFANAVILALSNAEIEERFLSKYSPSSWESDTDSWERNYLPSDSSVCQVSRDFSAGTPPVFYLDTHFFIYLFPSFLVARKLLAGRAYLAPCRTYSIRPTVRASSPVLDYLIILLR